MKSQATGVRIQMISCSGALMRQAHSSGQTLAMFFGIVSLKMKISSVMTTVARTGPDTVPTQKMATTVAKAEAITVVTLLPISRVINVLSNLSRILRARRALFFPSSAQESSRTRLRFVYAVSVPEKKAQKRTRKMMKSIDRGILSASITDKTS